MSAEPLPSRPPSSFSGVADRDNTAALIVFCLVVVACFTVLRGIFAATNELRVDEAYYWTWSKESVVSYLDHPPLIAWCVRFGTLVFGDTNFGIRFSGLLGMLLMQLLLADIVWQVLRDYRYVLIAVLLPEASPAYGFLMTKVAPDTALIPLELAMIASLVRLSVSGNPRWWIAAGVFGGLALLAKYTVVLLLPAVLAFTLISQRRTRWLASPYPWLAWLCAIAIFLPVVYWNATHDWASFRFQLDRPAQLHTWSAKFLGDFIGQQFLLVGPLLFVAVLSGTGLLAWRGFRQRDAVSILLSGCVVFPLAFFAWRSFYGRIGDSWPLLVWPFAFACTAINLKKWRETAPDSRLTVISPAIGSGLAIVATLFAYYLLSDANYLGKNDPIGKEAGFARVVEAADRERERIGATYFATTDYRITSMLRWHLRDRVPVAQINERNRYLGFRIDARLRADATGLYVGPKDDPIVEIWKKTTAKLKPLGETDLVWRGFRYDTYSLQKITSWQPVLSPPPGDALYVGAPH